MAQAVAHFEIVTSSGRGAHLARAGQEQAICMRPVLAWAGREGGARGGGSQPAGSQELGLDTSLPTLRPVDPRDPALGVLQLSQGPAPEPASAGGGGLVTTRVIYLLHFDRPFGQARHYMGSAVQL